MERYAPLTPKFAWQMAAPHTWVASAIPALFGILYSILRGWILVPWKFAALFATCVLMQSAVNVLNDYMDFVKGTDSKSDHVEESDAVLVYHKLNPKHVLALGIVYLAAGALLGLLACRGSGPLPVGIGILGGLVVTAYSAGPLPIAYLPFGELVSGSVMGGLIPLGITAAASGTLYPEVLIYSLPLILGIALIMMTNNGCDIEKDERAGRQTLAVRLRRPRTVRIYHILLMIWLVLIVILSVRFLPGGAVGIVCLLLFARVPFGYLLRSQLAPKHRIRQMGSIVSANLKGNGAYLITIAAALAWSLVHG